MKCKYCNGTKKIFLLYSETDCTECNIKEDSKILNENIEITGNIEIGTLELSSQECITEIKNKINQRQRLTINPWAHSNMGKISIIGTAGIRSSYTEPYFFELEVTTNCLKDLISNYPEVLHNTSFKQLISEISDKIQNAQK